MSFKFKFSIYRECFYGFLFESIIINIDEIIWGSINKFFFW